MKKLFFLIFAFLIVFMAAPSFSQIESPVIPETGEVIKIEAKDLGVYNPTLLPDSKIYMLKTAWEKIANTILSVSPTRKTKYQIKLASKRLLEAQRLAEKGKTELAQKQLEKFQEKLETVAKKSQKLTGKNKENFNQKASEAVLKHFQVLRRIQNQVPDQAKNAIEGMIEKSMEHLSKFLPENSQQIEESINNLPGNDFKAFSYLKPLTKAANWANEAAKKAVSEIEENLTKKTNEEINSKGAQDQEVILNKILFKIDQKETKQLELFQKVLESAPKEIRERIEASHPAVTRKLQVLKELAK